MRKIYCLHFGVEIPYFAYWEKNERSGQKARHSFKINGGAEGDRTLGLMTASHALSQLSYSPT